MKGRSRLSRAQTMVVITIVLPVLLAGVGVAADIGILYFNWVQLQKAADAAAIAGAEYLMPSSDPTPNPPSSYASGCSGKGTTAESVACNYVTYNSALSSEFTSSVPASNPPPTVPAGVQTIQVNLSRPNVPTYFLRLVGLNSLSVRAQAVAMAPTCITGGGNGLFPIGLPNMLPGDVPATSLKTGDTVTLVEGVSPGNWEWLNIPPNYTAPTTPTSTNSGGNSQLASTIATGCVNCVVDVGSYVSPQTGGQGSSNGVSSAVGNRITNSDNLMPASGGDPGNGFTVTSNGSGGLWSNSTNPLIGQLPISDIPNGASALVTVPVVNWTTSTGSSTPVQVQGFAVVWLDAYSRGGGSGNSSNPDSLKVTFLNMTTTIQTTGGSCVNKYPGLTQAELIQ